jgi:hypothetical protein
MLVHLKSKY